MQKKVKWFIAAFVAALLFLSCQQSTDAAGGGSHNTSEQQEQNSEYPMVSVKGGSITGTDTTTKSEPTHNQTFLKGRQVKLDDFSIGKYEVTYELWYKVITEAEKRGYVFKNKGRAGTIAVLDKNDEGKYVAQSRVGEEPDEETKKHPVTQIAWCDAIVWCNAYSEITGKMPVYCLNGQPVKDSTKIDDCLKAEVKRTNGGYRLPTSTEWEWAARGGNPQDAAWGDGNDFPGTKDPAKLSEYACFGDKENGSTKPVGSLKPNVLGLYDMAGNVAECCIDLYAALIRVDPDVVEDNPDHPKSAILDKQDPTKFNEFERTGGSKCTRGGAWKKNEADCKNGSRGMTLAKYANDAIGFRLVLSH
ncbi:formylglycine-generating enzyme family protein [Treponema phagedenis]|uniref:formylglycine-generating enzyme family protein n=1 Tax=Treponema phagedenis TaxID=162 RepID=UPI0001F63835|nr:SUMF1/EgtB/PvdO family nonheme iron enzyme [Treponema phagedenis]EFW36670.1 hypothetical protein HMPREF9554_02785 [Treponema phagedenis F0421]TYT79016.1 formylglycine-generating enzyme family protein [Treponema phagedenis]